MTTQVNEVLEKIRKVCDLRELDDACGIYPISEHDWENCQKCYKSWSEPHLEHLLWAVGKDQDEIAIRGRYLLLPFNAKDYSYDLQKSVEQNLNDNPDLTEWLHEVLVTK